MLPRKIGSGSENAVLVPVAEGVPHQNSLSGFQYVKICLDDPGLLLTSPGPLSRLKLSSLRKNSSRLAKRTGPEHFFSHKHVDNSGFFAIYVFIA